MYSEDDKEAILEPQTHKTIMHLCGVSVTICWDIKKSPLPLPRHLYFLYVMPQVSSQSLTSIN